MTIERPSQRRIICAWITLALVAGSSWLAVRIGLDDLPPFTFSGIRFAVAAPLLALILWIRNRGRDAEARAADPHGSISPTREQWRVLIAIGIQVFIIGNAASYWGQQYVPSGITGVLYSTGPAAAMLIARVRIGDPISFGRAIGLALGIAGVVLISGGQIQLGGLQVAAGLAGIAVGVLCLAWATVSVRALSSGLDPLFIAMVQISMGAIAQLSFGYTLESSAPFRLTLSAVGAIVWLAIAGSLVAFWLWYWLLRYMEATQVLSHMLVTPIIALFLGWALRGEQVGWIEVGGVALVLGGVYLVLSARRDKTLEH